MYFTQERLNRWKSGATILSLLAVPLVIALVGWLVQRQIAAEATKREYMQVAMDILRDAGPTETPDQRALRVWAVEIVKEFSPVEVSGPAREAMLKGGLGSAPTSPTLTVQ